jgi:hypothetical protein
LKQKKKVLYSKEKETKRAKRAKRERKERDRKESTYKEEDEKIDMLC